MTAYEKWLVSTLSFHKKLDEIIKKREAFQESLKQSRSSQRKEKKEIKDESRHGKLLKEIKKMEQSMDCLNDRILASQQLPHLYEVWGLTKESNKSPVSNSNPSKDTEAQTNDSLLIISKNLKETNDQISKVTEALRTLRVDIGCAIKQSQKGSYECLGTIQQELDSQKALFSHVEEAVRIFKNKDQSIPSKSNSVETLNPKKRISREFPGPGKSYYSYWQYERPYIDKQSRIDDEDKRELFRLLIENEEPSPQVQFSNDSLGPSMFRTESVGSDITKRASFKNKNEGFQNKGHPIQQKWSIPEVSSVIEKLGIRKSVMSRNVENEARKWLTENAQPTSQPHPIPKNTDFKRRKSEINDAMDGHDIQDILSLDQND